jgi:acetoin:2,6-dichlorophenolindophenol oxidoreductase subunit beta
MKHMSFAAAFVEGLYEAMAADERVCMFTGHPVGFGAHRPLMDRVYRDFHDRIFDPPNSEAAVAGLGAGAAMLGDRPFVNMSTATFSLLAMSQIANEAANVHHMSNGQLCAPVVYYVMHGVRGGGAAQHSGSPQGLFWNCPGLQIAVPSTPADAKGLLLSAFKGRDPTVYFSHSRLLGVEGPVAEGKPTAPFGRAEIRRAGRDVTLVATSYMAVVAMEAAAVLAGQGIEAEVVDLRTLVPLDEETLLASVARTGRLVVVDEAPLRCGPASEIAATVVEKGFRALRAAPVRVTRADVPIPYSVPLEAALTPDAAKVVHAVQALLR